MEQSLIQTLNSQSRNMQIDVRVITLDDNLFHPYFTSIDISKDNLSPIGTAKAETVYSDEILKYWTNYIGTVIMSFNMKELQHINTNSVQYAEAHELPQRLTNDQYNYSLICKVSKLKHKGKQIIIYFEDLGWKFLQKVPSDFRNAYIAGQTLDKAFQAMCEFLGVEFAYSIEALQEYNFGADGYSVEKDGEVIETVKTILSEQSEIEEGEEEEETDENENNPLDQENYENPSLIEYDNEHQNDENYVRNDTQSNNKIEQTSEEDEAIEKYQEEFDKKIINLFIGNTYYESDLTSNIMDYGKITITPSASDTSTNSGSVSDVNTDSGSESNDTDNNNSNNNSNNNISNSTKNKKKLIHFSEAYIRTLKPSIASKLAKEVNVYDEDTIKRLRRRAIGLFW